MYWFVQFTSNKYLNLKEFMLLFKQPVKLIFSLINYATDKIYSGLEVSLQ